MFDKTNQTETTSNMAAEENYGEILDSVMDDECEKDEDETVFDLQEGENQMPEGNDDRFRVVYNGKEMFLSLDELKTNAQKGLNYDHVKNEYDILRSQPGANELLKDARESGLSSEAYLSKQKLRDKRVRVEDLMSRGMAENEALYVTDLEDKLERGRIEEEKRKPYYEFIKAYPDVSPESVPKEVWDKFDNGMSLVAAYAMYENERLREEARIMAQNSDNASRSVGSVVGNAGENVTDAFLQGLFG